MSGMETSIPVILDKYEQEALLATMESSLRVNNKNQLFLWSQGQFQGLLPHHTLVLLQFAESGRTINVECITMEMLGEPRQELLCDPQHGLAVRIARYSHAAWIRPLLLGPPKATNDGTEAGFLNELSQHELGSALVHGTQSTRGGGWDYLVLLRQKQSVTTRDGYFMELLMPYLHFAYQRVMSLGASPRLKVTRPAGIALTGREQEIMHWVREGKSNIEIGEILAVSSLTVKNHVQNILKKLRVQNRAQAVSRAITLGLLENIQ